jgi:hypothetical protein
MSNSPYPSQGWLKPSIAAWCLLISAAFVEGIFRRISLEPHMAKISAEVIGIALVLVSGFLIASWFARTGRFPQESRQLIAIGLLWVALTVAFEFVFFGLVMRISMEELLENYDVVNGDLFPIGLLLLVFVPWSASRASFHHQRDRNEFQARDDCDRS